MFDRIKVLAGSFVTYLVAAQAAVTGALVALEPYKDEPWIGDIIVKGGPVVSALATAVLIVRSVTQVPDDLKGLVLPRERDFYDAVDDEAPDFWGEG